MEKIEEKLQTAFAGESQANRKYLAYSKKADEEGYKQIARLFRAVAAAETIHAHNHLRIMGGIKTTEENLKAAIEGEHYEFTKMYPEFIEQANKESKKRAARSFEWANEVEKVHGELYSKYLERLKAGEKFEEEDFYVCEVCGYTVEGETPDKCPVCRAVKEKFMKIE